MDARSRNKALFRSKLNAQKKDKRIESPLVRYFKQFSVYGIVEFALLLLICDGITYLTMLYYYYYTRYNESDQPVCRVCDLVLKSESFWDAHQASRKHHEVNVLLFICYPQRQ